MVASRFAFLTEAQFDQLLANGRQSQVRSDFDPLPVVKLFTPDAGATWLPGGIDPDAPDIAFGLCDVGMGFPEPGWVSLVELSQLRGILNLRSSRTCISAPFGARAPMRGRPITRGASRPETDAAR